MSKRIKINCNEKCACEDSNHEILPCDGGLAEYHHIKNFGSGGSNHPNNLIPLCRRHHRMVHNKGLNFMCFHFYSFQKCLVEKEWQFNDYLQKWMNYEPYILRAANKQFQ